ncbi:E3 ubiquitin-protein ligase smurf2 [Dermatophagoides farinae]|uniref:E3 ubiquitin-protein ligase smurf2 n=1 Tax=Dermatophagoides farinae TaxID=6954 RepID=A0A922ID00_DERFA|nr:E3 ubiquitin-protein ligase smurf2 [Dermatophagoides farinae]
MATQTIALSTSSQSKLTTSNQRNHRITVPSETDRHRKDNISSSNNSTASTSPITSTTGSPITHPTSTSPSSGKQTQQQQQQSNINENMASNMVIDSPIHHQHSNSSCSNGQLPHPNRLQHHRRSHSQIVIASSNSQPVNCSSAAAEISKIRLNGLPDPFCKITVDACPSNAITGNQCHTTDMYI